MLELCILKDTGVVTASRSQGGGDAGPAGGQDFNKKDAHNTSITTNGEDARLNKQKEQEYFSDTNQEKLWFRAFRLFEYILFFSLFLECTMIRHFGQIWCTYKCE
mmetsp:Transcript_37303/g.64723  ORF Transcript_37303/g.64723 Transcript_37303/m.64723 type:complete len:105 (-) Transcript_37303:129-443(-)